MSTRLKNDFVGLSLLLVIAGFLFLQACGGSSSSGGGSAPTAPTGLTATAGNMQVSLSWSASSGATSYNVERGTASGGPYTTVNSPSTITYVDTGLTNGTTYYYVVTAVNSAGQSAPSSQATAIPAGPVTQVAVTVNVLANRHPISTYVYGGSFPQDAPTITDSGLTVVRWGGNGASTYNNQLGTYNADNDYYFEDYAFNGFSSLSTETGVSSSTTWIQDVQGAGSNPLMTMVMLPWVAQTPEVASPPNGHWSFSVATYGAQCSTDQYNSDAGNGVQLSSNCATNPVYITDTNYNDAYFPLLDDSSQTCSSGNCVYRQPWATALAAAFNGGNTPHFYDMDNEIDIWGSTHRDIHPSPTTYEELLNVYLTEAANLKTWDPQAMRFGWVSCCWSFYWNSAAGASDKSSNANIDFMPWWLNQVAWNDAVSGARTLDVFDVHAYPETSSSGLTTAQAQALTLSSTRDWWDPAYTSQAWFGTVSVTTNEPLDNEPFRIPRLRAWANAIYPGTPLSFTEWNFGLVGESDFSTALSDDDAYGVLGRERMYLASRWTAPSPTNPNYLALKLFTNYDGAHHGFGTTSILDTNNGSPSLFSSYAALNSAGTAMTLLVLNKDPQNSNSVTFTLTGFLPSSFVRYTLAATAPTAITASSSASWSSTMTFAPYTATLLLINGSVATTPASEWDLNPDTTMVAAGGTVTLQPEITIGTANVTLQSAVFDSFEGAAACTGGIITLTSATVTPSQPGTITVTAGDTPSFCHFTVTGTDGTAAQTKGGWIVVGNPSATLTQTGSGQSGAAGTALPEPLTVTLIPGQSGGTNTGANILFSASAGTLSNGTNSGAKVIAITNSSGVASVTLMLPSAAGSVNVTAEGPYGLGHPVATFTETSQ
jgi:hypothetical protein